MIYDLSHTIAAIATATGESGVGIIRISGTEAYNIGEKIFRSKGKTRFKDFKDRTIHFGTIVDEKGREIDEALVLIMKRPHSYTAEDILEIQCHGGRQSVSDILKLVLRSGARLARAGEFTQRAFMNGRIDLVQAEAVMDVIQAKSSKGLSTALSQLEGRLSGIVADMRTELTDFITRLEVTVDYPEEDLEDIVVHDLEKTMRCMMERMEQMLKDSSKGRIIRDGMTVAIAGAPNAGKSSLLNYLLAEDRAIVTDIPGTTRDALEEWVSIQGIPFRLVDTAGIRETTDTVEAIGVTKARNYIETADTVLILKDRTQPFSDEDKALINSVPDGKGAIVLTKSDLKPLLECKDLEVYGLPVFSLSSKTGDGISLLEEYLVSRSGESGAGENEVLLSNMRHIELMRQSLNALKRAEETMYAGMPTDLILVDLREAWELLGAVTGETVQDDMVGEIFSRFCLGK